ncbi:splicing factor 3B subunit 3 [Marchantia polymorpha subsp. ruderalis]|uniref:DNA damage-binding protein 1 n=2 Tax=Marchantia polymorpha TaxID=3197 RepID=A0AAF6ALB3_MARPO|nr:hypothetical protein MARPO_0005s0200 [Marchantia polymorpha]BBM97233.1 hypothetical protein Mp_1g04070 [Marchantia polymorpha subsp. ruderalis]|eukprot:PTQ48575.1 hypothetical protein MARPO_0005s0200 [Marchantia polymorpha]
MLIGSSSTMAVPDGVSTEPGDAQPSLYVAKCVLRSSAVLQAVYGHIRSPSTLDLVFGKETTLELAVVSDDGVVQSLCEQPVFGSIKDLKILPWNEEFRGVQPELYGKDLLVLLSDSEQLSFLTFNVELHRFLAVSHTSLGPPGKDEATGSGRLLAVEPRGRAIAVAAFEDTISVFLTSSCAGNNIVEDKRLVFPRPLAEAGEQLQTGRWGTIWSVAFVQSAQEDNQIKDTTAIVLAVLVHMHGRQENDIQVLSCDTRERIIHHLATFCPTSAIPGVVPGHLALSIIEFPVVPGYLLLARLGDLLLLDLRCPSIPRASTVLSAQQASVDEDGEGQDTLAAASLLLLFSRYRDSSEKGSISAWSWQPDGGDQPKLVLCMDSGEIAIAQVFMEGSDVHVQIHERLYRCSPCHSLLWLNGGFIAALIEMGDGEILEVLDGGLTFRSYILNNAPILDFALVDYHGEKQDQMFACCGVGREGAIRVIRNGISVEKLHSTPPLYQGVTGTWTLRMFQRDKHHSFFVMSFVEETRVLSVGLNFVDISDAVGFDSSSSTLTCGLIEDGWIAQVCSSEVLLCAPTIAAHPAGLANHAPQRTSWKPREACISLGAVAKGSIILALSRPGVLLILGTRLTSTGDFELIEIQQCQLEAEVSCISIPLEEGSIPVPVPPSMVGLMDDPRKSAELCGVVVGEICVVGTHKPSVELLSIRPGENFRPLAVGLVALVNSIGTAMGGCVPETVRLALFDRLYIICGLRNGMLLRFEWPSSRATQDSAEELVVPLSTSAVSAHKFSSKTVDVDKSLHSKAIFQEGEQSFGIAEERGPVLLNLVAVRRIGVSPVTLIPLQGSLRADIIALSDRPWLLQTARQSQRIAYTSISFQASTHAAPVNYPDCPNGILFVADCSLHLVEMEHSKRLNVQRLPLGRTPRRVLYHAPTAMLVVLRSEHGVSDICCVDPLSGTISSCYQLVEGETAKCMQLWHTNGEELVLVGTSLTDGKPMMPNGEPESSKGRLLMFRIESKAASGRSKRVPLTGIMPLVGMGESSSAGTCQPMIIGDSTPDEVAVDEHMMGGCEGWELSLISSVSMMGMVLAVCPYLDQYVLVGAGNNLICYGQTHDSYQRLRRFAAAKTRFVITNVAVHLNRIAVGDCRDGILFYSYREDTHTLEQLHCDPVKRLVADCVLTELNTAVVTDRNGNFCILSSANGVDDCVSPERNLSMSCWYHMGEPIVRIKKGFFSYRAPVEETLKTCSVGSSSVDATDASLVGCTLLGSVVILIQLPRDDYDLLEAVQVRLASHRLTAPLLGNNHAQYRRQGCPAGDVRQVLDGDMLGQFLELTNAQQRLVLLAEPGTSPEDPREARLHGAFRKPLPLDQVLRLFERVHNYLT